ncbi:hypothetical protein [Nocardia sp. NPDC005825]|uniref:hypothetical protein n=1 Tax=unclassified Nocardia TaxID=2637762 RepID=UPI0033F293EF
MTEAPRPRRSRFPASSAELVARRQRSRQRSLQRRTAAVVREKAITRGVEDYLVAWNAIADAEQRRDSDVAALRAQIDVVNSRAAKEISTHEQAQATAAAGVRTLVQTDEELADLLEVTVKRARQLLASSRTTTADEPRGKTSSKKAGPTGPPIQAEPTARQMLGVKVSDTVAPAVPPHPSAAGPKGPRG